MDEPTVSLNVLSATSKQIARRLLTIGENRLELLMVELQEERERLFHAFLLALGLAAFGLLFGITLTAAIVVLFWSYSPTVVLLTLAAIHGAAAVGIYLKFRTLLRDWKNLPATLDELRKDRVCIEQALQ